MPPSRFHRSTSKIVLLLLSVTACFVLMGTVLSQTLPTEQAKTIKAPQPVFPEEAKNYIYGDSITVFLEVDKTGRVSKARSSGPIIPCSNRKDKGAAAINKAAIAAAKATVFEPFQKDGKPSETKLYVTYELRPRQSPSAQKGITIVEKGPLNGKAISLPKPDYSDLARANRTGGAVPVQVLIGENGRVLSAGALSGHPYLQEGAVQSACGARFAEVRLSGQLVRVSGVIMYNFVP